MPIYDYRCVECGSTYDVFHKVKEVVEDVVCPSCGSSNYKRLISAASVSTGVASRAASTPMPSSSGGCGCSGGMCGMN